MASADVTLTIRVIDMASTKLLLWELRMLADEMRVSADPYAERLERALDRFTDTGPDDEVPV